MWDFLVFPKYITVNYGLLKIKIIKVSRERMTIMTGERKIYLEFSMVLPFWIMPQWGKVHCLSLVRGCVAWLVNFNWKRKLVRILYPCDLHGRILNLIICWCLLNKLCLSWSFMIGFLFLFSAFMKLQNIAEFDCWTCFVKHWIQIYTNQGFLVVMWVMEMTVACPHPIILSFKAVVLYPR